MNRETKNRSKSKISKKNKKDEITMDFMYSVFGLEDNYTEDPNPTRGEFFKKVTMKVKSIIITSMTFINSLPL